jgi:hypothetical protein
MKRIDALIVWGLEISKHSASLQSAWPRELVAFVAYPGLQPLLSASSSADSGPALAFMRYMKVSGCPSAKNLDGGFRVWGFRV